MFAARNIMLASAYSPLSLSPSVWLDGTDTATLFDATSGGSLVAPGAAVARWEDKSGNARHATTTTVEWRPSRVVSGINTRGSLGFSSAAGSALSVVDCGVSSRLDFTLIAVHLFVSLGNWSMIGGHIIANTERQGITAQGNILLQRKRLLNEFGCHNAGVSGDQGVHVDLGAGGLTIPRVSMLRRSGATAGNLGNGATNTVRSNLLSATATQSWNTNADTTRLQLGGRQSGSLAFFDGEIGEVIVVPRAITDAEANALFAHLGAKYGIPVY